LYGFKPIKLVVSAFAGNSIWLFCFAPNEAAQTLLQLPFVGVGVDNGAQSLDREEADQQGKNDCKQDGDSVHGSSPFVLVIRLEIQKTVLARCGMITHLPCPPAHITTSAQVCLLPAPSEPKLVHVAFMPACGVLGFGAG
jgi:hypothetical protein